MLKNKNNPSLYNIQAQNTAKNAEKSFVQSIQKFLKIFSQFSEKKLAILFKVWYNNRARLHRYAMKREVAAGLAGNFRRVCPI